MNENVVPGILFYLICFTVPVMLLIFLCLGIYESKCRHRFLNEEKEYYWLKTIRLSKKLEEDNCLFGFRFLIVWSVILIASFLLLMIIASGAEDNEFVLLDFDDLNQIFFSVLGLLVAILTGWVIIPGLSEPPVRTLGATIPENESHIFR